MRRTVRRAILFGTIVLALSGCQLVHDRRRWAGPGPAATNVVMEPSVVAVAPNGAVYVADVGQSLIRVVDASTHTSRVVAGTGVAGFAGDRGPATFALLNVPFGLAVDRHANLLIADTSRPVRRCCRDHECSTASP